MKSIDFAYKGVYIVQLLLCMGAGFAIGIIFNLLRLPVPVPHGWGGVVGLIGMFIGEKIFQLIISRIG
jgi:XapX domain-containing protein